MFPATFCSSDQKAEVLVSAIASQMRGTWEADEWVSGYNQDRRGQEVTVSLVAWKRYWYPLEVGVEVLCSPLAAGREKTSWQKKMPAVKPKQSRG